MTSTDISRKAMLCNSIVRSNRLRATQQSSYRSTTLYQNTGSSFNDFDDDTYVFNSLHYGNNNIESNNINNPFAHNVTDISSTKHTKTMALYEPKFNHPLYLHKLSCESVPDTFELRNCELISFDELYPCVKLFINELFNINGMQHIRKHCVIQTGAYLHGLFGRIHYFDKNKCHDIQIVDFGRHKFCSPNVISGDVIIRWKRILY